LSQVYLFDWGDTLMVDIKGASGKMRDWPNVEMVKGADIALSKLAKQHAIYIATGAADSSADDIKAAFERIDLAQYITGYFCQANLGVGKGDVNFYLAIMNKLQLPASNVVMVGDSLSRDIVPAIECGLGAIWFNPNAQPSSGIKSINSLIELISLNLG